MRITLRTAVVLRCLLDAGQEPVYGMELTDRTGLKGGTLYPMLSRLARAGWATGEKEKIDPSAAGRPARRYWRLTESGAAASELALKAITDLLRNSAAEHAATRGGIEPPTIRLGGGISVH